MASHPLTAAAGSAAGRRAPAVPRHLALTTAGAISIRAEDMVMQEDARRNPAGGPTGRPARASSDAAPILSLDKALSILGCFADGGQLSVAEISRRLDLHQSIVSRMLATMETHGYVRHLGERGKYVVGVMPLILASAAVEQLPLRRQAFPVLERLADTHHVDANLGTVHDGLVLYLARVPRDPTRRASVFAGKRAPLHCTGVGKALLVGRPDEEVRELVSRQGMAPRTAHSLTSVEALLEDLAGSRLRGYVVEREEIHPDVACLGAPLRSPDGTPHAAISLSLSVHDLTVERQAVLGRALLDAVFDISRAAE